MTAAAPTATVGPHDSPPLGSGRLDPSDFDAILATDGWFVSELRVCVSPSERIGWSGKWKAAVAGTDYNHALMLGSHPRSRGVRSSVHVWFVSAMPVAVGGRRMLFVVVALVGAGAVAAGVLLVLGGWNIDGKAGDGGPGSTERAGAGSAAAEYLAGPGAPALRARAASDPVVGQSTLTPGACSATMQSVGAAWGGSPRIPTLAQVPDEELATLMLDEDAARTELLQRCSAGSVSRELVDEVVTLDRLVDARLGALGVRP